MRNKKNPPQSLNGFFSLGTMQENDLSSSIKDQESKTLIFISAEMFGQMDVSIKEYCQSFGAEEQGGYWLSLPTINCLIQA